MLETSTYMPSIPDSLSLSKLTDHQPFQIAVYEGDNTGWTGKTLRNHDFTVFWLVEGSGQLCIDLTEYAIKPGQIITMVPGQTCEGRVNYSKLVVMRTMDGFFDHRYRTRLLFMKTFFPDDSRGAFFEVDSLESDHLMQLAHIMIHQQKKAAGWDLLTHLAGTFLAYISHCKQITPASTKLDDRIIELLILIEKHFRNYKNASFYARHLSLTNKRLNELTRKQLNKTITQLVHDRIVLEARRALIDETKFIKSISHELGFPDSSYFSRFYRKQTGESPMAFRQAMLK